MELESVSGRLEVRAEVEMKPPLLVLDVHYLCHRAFHAQGHLSWKGDATGVIFGFLKSISVFKDEFQTDRIAFCFEGKNLHRKKIYPDYKSKRRPKTDQEIKAYNDLSAQIQLLRNKYLRAIGFRNIFSYEGFESDDVMAVLADQESKRSEVILITADSDMYQCLKTNVSIYHPQKQVSYNESWFRKKYGISPREWALVKALSGCSSDNVKGIPGVGEITALKFIKNQMEDPRKVVLHLQIAQSNKKLVKLPFDGCPIPKLKKDRISMDGWQSVCDRLGMRSIAGSPPTLNRTLGITSRKYAMSR